MQAALSVARAGAVVALLLATGLVGCSTAPYQVVRPPQRDAALYPVSQRQGDIAVAVDEVRDPQRVERYFGINLLEAGVLPVNITVSNYGEHRLSLHPGDVLLYRGHQVIDPIPVQAVASTLAEASSGVTREAHEQIEDYLEEISLQEFLVAPGESAQGMLFFDLPGRRGGDDWRDGFRVTSLFLASRLRLKLVVEDLDAEQRVTFGPFGLSHDLFRGWFD